MVIRINSNDFEINRFKPSIACIGYFDGVHLGHQKLIEKTINEANRLNVKSTIICFDPDPLDIISGKNNKHITSFTNRINIFKSLEFDQIVIIKFDRALMNIKPNLFIKNYLNRMNIVELVYGFDFSFGYKGLGNSQDLIKYGKFKTLVTPEIKYYGKKISSTRIKEEIYKGNFTLVNKLLGWDYYNEILVCDCKKVKNKYILETKLIDPNCLLPKDGKYDNCFTILNERIYITGNKKLKIGQKLLISFSNYE